MNRKELPIAEIVSLYLQGISIMQLAEKYNVWTGTLKNRLVEAGVILRSHKESLQQLSARKLMSDSAIGRASWNKGLTKYTHKSIASAANKLRVSNIGHFVSDETKEKHRIAAIKRGRRFPYYANCVECGRNKKENRCKLCRKCTSKRALRFCSILRKTKPEIKVEKLLGYLFGQYSPYEYTGSRSFWIDFLNDKRKNPDFTSFELNKVIEVFGRYWHKDEDPNDLIKQYKDVGWDCLVLWEDEVNADSIYNFTFPWEYLAEIEKFRKEEFYGEEVA
ncbi:hypothetical protein C4577_02225 [Candidatus Parcubacteria bacterium]|nr:MAG: hypothetical protein C4577_02225 [Candidatus Parcubacteria bacterium]